MSDFKITTDHRIQGYDLWAFPPESVVRFEVHGYPAYTGDVEVKIGLDAIFGDRSEVRDGCSCDYCNWVPRDA